MVSLGLSSLDPLFRALYSLAKTQGPRVEGQSRIRAGHSFENETAQLVYSRARECGLKAFPPRQRMNIPTRSGNSYQFDASFSHGETIYLVECKKRQFTAAEHVPYFVSKVLDHNIVTRGRGSQVKGIFLSSVEVSRNSVQFGFAFGLRIVDPSNPPLEELYSICRDYEPMRRAIQKLWDQVNSIDPLNPRSGPSPQTLLKSYEFLKRRASNIQ